MWKEKRFNVFSATLWAKQKVILISLTPRDYHLQFIVSCLRPIKLSTLFSHELLAFISVSRHFWSHHPNKACLFLKGLPAKKLNLVIVILFPLRKKNYFWFKFSKINDKKEIIIIPNNLITFVESFQIGINFWFGLQNIKGLHYLYLLNLWSHQQFFLLAPSHYFFCQ